jgi:hypothetical protein
MRKFTVTVGRRISRVVGPSTSAVGTSPTLAGRPILAAMNFSEVPASPPCQPRLWDHRGPQLCCPAARMVLSWHVVSIGSLSSAGRSRIGGNYQTRGHEKSAGSASRDCCGRTFLKTAISYLSPYSHSPLPSYLSVGQARATGSPLPADKPQKAGLCGFSSVRPPQSSWGAKSRFIRSLLSVEL